MKDKTCESCTCLRGFICDRTGLPTPFPDKECCDNWAKKDVKKRDPKQTKRKKS